eukprot:SAG11_NODE_7812_length_1093_cov_1.363179_1_plen_179_part_00
MRDAIRAGLLGPPENEPAPAPGVVKPDEVAPPEPEPEPEPEPPTLKAPVVPQLDHPVFDKDDLLSKPAWALTEDEADEKDALQEEVDIDDLLDFVEGLDFEQYIDDMEVQQALEIMKSRVARIDTARDDGPAPDAGAPKMPVDVSKESESWNAATKVRTTACFSLSGRAMFCPELAVN